MGTGGGSEPFLPNPGSMEDQPERLFSCLFLFRVSNFFSGFPLWKHWLDFAVVMAALWCRFRLHCL